MEELPKVLYILSVGHSGSTLLDILLSQLNAAFSCGELKHITWQWYREDNGIADEECICTCGKPFHDCALWSKVLNEISSKYQVESKQLPVSFLIKHLDDLSYFENNLRKKVIRKVYTELNYQQLWSKVFSSILFDEINRNNIFLYKAIANASNARYIIDSSKDTVRAKELSANYRDFFFPIILIRSIDGIVKSKYKSHHNRSEQIRAWREYYNKKVIPIIRGLKDSQFHVMSYEKLINKPTFELDRLARKLNAEFSSNVADPIDMKSLHLCAGNPMRLNSAVQIRESVELDEVELIKRLQQGGLDEAFVKRIK